MVTKEDDIVLHHLLFTLFLLHPQHLTEFITMPNILCIGCEVLHCILNQELKELMSCASEYLDLSFIQNHWCIFCKVLPIDYTLVA